MSIELSKLQVDRIVRAAGGEESLSALLRRGLPPSELPDRLAAFSDRRLSRSLLAGLVLYASFPRDGGSLGIKDLARRTGMNPGTTHRYVTTLVEVGLLERHPKSRLYRLAP
ncbi:MAG: helix-turn-helix domain-containing protein [Solirubrobacterales bacterium]|nr:helix-turn-helix domain-containing protein [Solirubrobacterales bacterium]